MRNIFRLTLITLFFFAVLKVGAQPNMRGIKPKSPIVCYQSFRNNPASTPPPQKFQEWRRNSAGRLKTANFEVEYINFPADNLAKNAFQYAIDIWETQIQSSVPIRVRAQWGTLANGVLGQAIWGSAFMNFEGAPNINTFYPVALAEKITGRELNASDQPDIQATFSSSVNWYFLSEGIPPSGQMDLITVVLHEIAHGLGFTDTYDVDNGVGSIGLDNGGQQIPFVYDLFIENENNLRLFNDFTSPGTSLAQAVTGGNLSYYSPSAIAATGSKPRVYAPSPFNSGSSIAHLDEATYNGNDPNRMMTPQIDFRETIHDPGDITRGILNDMGWVFTRINHTPLTDNERLDGQPYPVAAKIESDNGYDPASVKLHYTLDGTNFTVVTMTSTGVSNEYSASLPGSSSAKTYLYFISVEDVAHRAFTFPGKVQEQGDDPTQYFIEVKIGPDAEAPEIVHAPVDYVFHDQTQLELMATVTDNIAVDEVHVEFSVDGGSLQTVAMAEGANNEYTVTIPLPSSLEIRDKIKYRITARDVSANANVGSAPETDFYDVIVTGIMPIQDSYANDFDIESNDFVGSFAITTPPGFDNPAIHSKHPYDNGSGPNDESNYIYQLQIPIRIAAGNPYIRFDEIVLVEPGENGSTFGDGDFYDYVVVEGSKDGGTTWIAFEDGYDSRDITAWLTRYNSAVDNQNSTASGDPTLFRQRTINMIDGGDFVGGDEVLIRFRMFADQAAHGWGWAIDNLFIQDEVTGIEEAMNSFSIYPNPASVSLTVEFEQIQPIATFEITNLQGAQMLNHFASEKITNIDVQSLRSGIYILKAHINNRVIIKKFAKLD